MLLRKTIIVCCILLITASCKNDKQSFIQAENALDAGREFIDGCLKGNFEKAGFYMLHTPANDSILSGLQQEYNIKAATEKKQLKEASITILNVEEITDAATIITYSNSFNQTTRAIKVIRSNTIWQVDVNYTIKGNL